MAEFCYFILANGVLASTLALMVWCVSKWVRRPALLHLLWVLVLLRLVIPPLMTIDVSGARRWISNAAKRSSEEQQAVIRRTLTHQTHIVAAITKALQRPTVIPRRSVVPQADSVAAGDVSARKTMVKSCWLVTESVSRLLAKFRDGAIPILFPIWCVGTSICLVVQVRTAILFRRTVRRDGYRSRVWQQRTRKVARLMGVGHCPQLLLVRATTSPMLWGFGRRAIILFPEKLLESLDVRAQNTLIAHELAHYRRGDQWVRLLESVATTAFWWHPVLWWARHEIEKSEEHCCDAWAVTQSNGCPRTYAEALLATVDFVSTPSLPPIASGVSRSNFLRERLRAIMGERLRGVRTLIPNSYPSVVALAALVLIPCPVFWAKAPIVAPKQFAAVANASMAVTEASMAKRSFESSTATTNTPMVAALGLQVDSAQRATYFNRDTGVQLDLGVGHVASAAFSHDEQLLAIGTMSGKVHLISCRTGRTTRTYDLTHATISSVSFSPDDQLLAAGTRDGICRLVDLTGQGNEEVVRKRPRERVRCVRFSDNGRFASVVWDGRSSQQIEVWDLLSGRVSTTTPSRQGLVAAIDASDNDNQAWHLIYEDGVVSSWDGENEVMDRAESRTPQELRGLRIPLSPSSRDATEYHVDWHRS